LLIESPLTNGGESDPDVQELYRHLNISPDIIKPQHTWAPQDSD
jgi:hypothetical protein